MKYLLAIIYYSVIGAAIFLVLNAIMPWEMTKYVFLAFIPVVLLLFLLVAYELIKHGRSMKSYVTDDISDAAVPEEEDSDDEYDQEDEEDDLDELDLPFSIADEIEKFAELRDRGVISEEEFVQQKKKLLDLDPLGRK